MRPRHADRPPKVDNIQKYWRDPPPQLSPRCQWWVAQMCDGWYPNRRIRSEGYYSSAEYYGVYIWEYIHILHKMT